MPNQNRQLRKYGRQKSNNQINFPFVLIKQFRFGRDTRRFLKDSAVCKTLGARVHKLWVWVWVPTKQCQVWDDAKLAMRESV